jgi:hypothetical protein
MSNPSAARTKVCSGGHKAQQLSIPPDGYPSDRLQILRILSITTESSQVGTNAGQMTKQSGSINHCSCLQARWQKALTQRSSFRLLCIAISVAGALFATQPSLAQRTAPRPRITAAIDNSNRTTLAGTRSPRATTANDAGVVAPDIPLQGVTLIFSHTPAQKTALDALAALQQNPSSPLYYRWLSPEQFAAQFGVADADIATVSSWLEREGFVVGSVSRSRNRISFSGTAGQVASAFGTPLHYYKAQGEHTSHFAPSADLSIPAALAGVVQGIGNLSSFRPHSNAVKASKPQPLYTGGGNQLLFLTPPGVATVYDVNPAYRNGYNGSGQTIAIVGQSAVVPQDLANFQTALGVPVNPQTLNLIPGTGASALVQGDETESDLDLEYSSAMAPGAKVVFYYVGDAGNSDAFDSLTYAIDNDSASIISVSYATCEPNMGSGSLDAVLEQAAIQGQTVVVAAGDDGSMSCKEYTSNSPSVQNAPAVNYPASSPWVVAMGGTQFTAAAVVREPINLTYWTPAGNDDVVDTALSYIPEEVWNDTGEGLGAGGGGTSIFEPRPSWQTGVPGIADGNWRLVPDISLNSSDVAPGYLMCSSDTSYWGIAGSCTTGFVAADGRHYNVIGGTSVAAPIFAGMVAVLNQAKGYTNGQGLINPTLYTLASNPATYASAFHDITSGGNSCTEIVDCGIGPQDTDYLAGAGYDEASGLGSIDFANLVSAWPQATVASPAATTTALTPSSTSVAFGSSVIFTATVTNGGIGNVAFLNGEDTLGVSPVNGSGTATLSVSTLPVGANSITAAYAGAAEYAPSSSTPITVTVAPDNTTTIVVASSTSVDYGISETLGARVEANGSPATDGVVTFLFNGSSIGSGLVNNGVATISLTTLPSGADSITASFAGTANLAASASTAILVTVAPAVPVVAPTTTMLSVSSSTATFGDTVTFTAIVTSRNAPVAEGVVELFEGGNSIGSATVNSNGNATISLSTLPIGSNSIPAYYVGTANFATSLSSPVTETVSAPANPGPPATITVSTPPPVSPGSATTAVVSVAAGSRYSGTMNLTCTLTSSPVGAQYLPACSLTPSTIMVAANATATSTLTVQTTPTTTAALARPSGLTPWGLGGASAMAGLLMFCVPDRRRRMMSLLALLLVVLSVGAASCGSASPQQTTSAQTTTAGSYTFTVKAADTSNPSATASTVVTITVQ